ncbi:MAG: WblI protein, partial [Oscillospiraceae bacterium]|nr:WblI protein [Oscillospiraceae bacterium]
LAKAIAQKSRAKTAYEIHDIWPLSIMELYGFGEKNPIIKIIQKAEHFAYQNSDVVISILPDADKHIKELGYENINYVKIPNGVVLDSEREMIPQVQHELLDGYRKQDKFIVMYLGGFATANALEDLLDCSLLLPENAQIVMVGDGVLKKDFEQRIKDNEYQNITILPSVKKREVQDILSYADCLYIGAKECSLYRYGVGMNKIFDYMLAKKPIIYGVKASNDPIKDADCGITIQPESSSEIAKAICDLMDLSKERLDQMGENGYNYVVKNHDYKVLAEKFANALK